MTVSLLFYGNTDTTDDSYRVICVPRPGNTVTTVVLNTQKSRVKQDISSTMVSLQIDSRDRSKSVG